MKVLIKSFFVFLLLMLPLNLFAQTKIDSLETQLKIVDNKKKVEVLNELAQAYKSNLPEKTMDYGKQALELSKKIDYKEGKAKALNNIATAYYLSSEYNRSIEIFFEALQIFEDIENKKDIAQTLNNIGLVYNNLSKYDESLAYYLRSMKIRENIGDKKDIAASLNNIGNINWEIGKHSIALEYYGHSLQIYEEIDDKDGIAITNNNIGNIYYVLTDYEKSLKHFIKSLRIYEELDKKFGIAAASNNIAFVFQISGNYDKALQYSFTSLKISEEMEEKFSIANTSNNIGELYFLLENYDEALSYFLRSLKLAEEVEAKSLKKNSYHSLSNLYSIKNDYKKSLEYFKLYTEIKDSIFTEESSGKIAEMQTKYETEKKEKENVILKKDNKIQKLEINKQQNLRNSFIVISILILFVVFIIYARYRSKQKTNVILNQKNNVIENTNTELNQKNRQINKQKNQLSETLNELRETQKMLTDTAHRAGMAEIATGILHNVGNVLNSVKVSSQILKEKIKSSKVNNLQKVLSIIEEHTDNLGEYISSDEKGKMLPPYLLKVGTALKDEQNNSLEELSNLHKGINHIEEIIAVQQSYAGVSGLIEKVKLSKMMDDILKMHSEIFRKYKIKITKEYSKTEPILIEKGKLIQVFVNLLKNAKESLEAKEKDRIIIINILEDKGYQVIEIVDNGMGIVEKNLRRIFSYGFSTKKDGKGFGLHTSVLAMTEMKGKLIAESEGKGKGAKFIVSIPVNSK
ncbi:MAG: tetratricopeptide repeat-containing sensor histidine kinase [Candidatus Cloacimonadota bacterium]|nr:tetratricopeptide repeat-containing sensor histidine kinase [Candidatus Cloacimonadota bacterium]